MEGGKITRIKRLLRPLLRKIVDSLSCARRGRSGQKKTKRSNPTQRVGRIKFGR